MSFTRKEEAFTNGGRGEEKSNATTAVLLKLDTDVAEDLRHYTKKEGMRYETQSYVANQAIKEWLKKRREELRTRGV